MIKILHPEDLQSGAELVEYELIGSGVSFQKVVSDNKGRLPDHSLPSFNSFMALCILKEKNPDISFIL